MSPLLPAPGADGIPQNPRKGEEQQGQLDVNLLSRPAGKRLTCHKPGIYIWVWSKVAFDILSGQNRRQYPKLAFR
ncbi:hypothetical protein DUI87_13023 [Hirundo rustica rustica]|uniref:Uncharacterized protein n=1 Tax=Hirundo rustica rustica TaxID=333673 RepID=A0A3M0KAR4_HIRRU|nr:hypothetical protein DUI87_13023 [Hirundo rustica rustica]